MSHVFISYMRSDHEVVDRLVTVLRHHQIDVWLDRTDIQPGQRWQLAIRKAINSGAFFLICFSDAYHARSSTHTNEELVLAIEELRRRPAERTWFIPIVLDKSGVPERSIGAGELLTDLQRVDLSGDWGPEVEKLIKVLTPASSDQARSTGTVQVDLPAREVGRRHTDPLLASLELSKLEIAWRFADVPDRVERLVKVCFGTVDNEWYRDDNLGRDYSRSDQMRLRQGLATEYVLRPTLHAITNPDFEVRALFDGEIDDQALEDPQASGVWAQYCGPRHTLYLPLGVDGSAVLALGEIDDDGRAIPDDPNDIRTPIGGSERFFAEYTRHHFEADVEVHHDKNRSLQLSFMYGADSIHNAVARAFPGQRIWSLFPNVFNLVIANEKFDKETYLANLGRKFFLAEPENTNRDFQANSGDRSELQRLWTFRSDLVIVANSLSQYQQTYEVTCLGYGVSVDELPLGDSCESFEYLLFRCERTQSGASTSAPVIQGSAT